MKAERMTKNDNPNLQPVIVAAVIAGFLILVSSAAYHVLAARLAAPVNTSSLPPAALEKLPMQIGDWTGQKVPLDEAIVRATDTEAYINRRYSRRNALEHISLYVAYGVRARDLMPHRPEVCYTGAGWTLVDRSSMELPLSDGMKLPCRALQFSSGTLNTKKVVVLDYYIVDGQYCRDVSLLRSKAWRGSGTVRYVAQVQIVTPITANLTADSATRMVRAFAVDSASSISRLFESAEESRRSDKDRFNDNRMFGGTESG
ncbi:MAG: exosortase C-terminal domain/associated protein EpsI [Planctomycetota bacterium]|jgi:EpsI family protein